MGGLLIKDFQIMENGLLKSQTENLGKIWHRKVENLLNINSLLILSSHKASQWRHFSREKGHSKESLLERIIIVR
jgi:hypothetical protein